MKIGFFQIIKIWCNQSGLASTIDSNSEISFQMKRESVLLNVMIAERNLQRGIIFEGIELPFTQVESPVLQRKPDIELSASNTFLA